MKRVFVFISLLASTAFAQSPADTSFSVDHFHPSAHGDALFAAESGAILPSFALRAALVFDYANQPLEIRRTTGTVGLVQHRLNAHALFSVTLWDRLSLALAMPVTLYQRGFFSDLSGTGAVEQNTSAGDLRFEPKIGILDEKRFFLDLAILLSLGIPTGNEAVWAGDRSVTASGEIDVSKHLGPVRLALNLGYFFRLPSNFFGVTIGQELFGRFGVGFDIQKLASHVPLELIVEVFGRTGLASPFRGQGTNPVELMGGLKWRVVPSVEIMAGASAGLTASYGAPIVRGFFGVGWTPLLAFSPKQEEPASHELTPPEPEPAPQPATQQAETVADPIPVAKPSSPQQQPLDRPLVGNGAPTPSAADPRAPADAEQKPSSPVAEPAPIPALLTPEDDGTLSTKVFFALNSDVINAASAESLTALAAVLKAHPKTQLSVEGHTDSTGTEGLNQSLSERRANAIVRFLKQAGVSGSRLSAKGFGSSQPLVPETDATAQEKNRRVVFRLR